MVSRLALRSVTYGQRAALPARSAAPLLPTGNLGSVNPPEARESGKSTRSGGTDGTAVSARRCGEHVERLFSFPPEPLRPPKLCAESRRSEDTAPYRQNEFRSASVKYLSSVVNSPEFSISVNSRNSRLPVRRSPSPDSLTLIPLIFTNSYVGRRLQNSRRGQRNGGKRMDFLQNNSFAPILLPQSVRLLKSPMGTSLSIRVHSRPFASIRVHSRATNSLSS